MRFALIPFALLALTLSSPLQAQPGVGAVRAEINALLDRLEASGCQFNRNGTWHSAVEAKAHLLGKLAYLEKSGTVQNTEQFIDLAASKSSVSGKPYQVMCGSAASVESKLWLSKELQAIRSSGKTKLSGT